MTQNSSKPGGTHVTPSVLHPSATQQSLADALCVFQGESSRGISHTVLSQAQPVKSDDKVPQSEFDHATGMER
jgi:hypothetical protein